MWAEPVPVHLDEVAKPTSGESLHEMKDFYLISDKLRNHTSRRWVSKEEIYLEHGIVQHSVWTEVIHDQTFPKNSGEHQIWMHVVQKKKKKGQPQKGEWQTQAIHHLCAEHWVET